MVGYDGETMAETMRSVGWNLAHIADAKRVDIDAFIELHVEQGPVLEHAGHPLAIVDAITGIRHYQVMLTGTQNHAGDGTLVLQHRVGRGRCSMQDIVDLAERNTVAAAHFANALDDCPGGIVWCRRDFVDGYPSSVHVTVDKVGKSPANIYANDLHGQPMPLPVNAARTSPKDDTQRPMA